MNIFRLIYKLYKMKKVDSLTKEKLEELKLKKLRKLLLYVYKYSPYYQRLFTDININEDFIKKINIKDLYKIPTMTKEKYVANYDDIVTDKNVNLESVINFDNRNDYVLDNQKLYLDKYHIIHTSGTEEKPFYVVYDKKAWEETIFGIIRIALWDLKFADLIKYITKKIRVCNLMSSDGRYAGCTSIADGLDILNVKYKSIDVGKELDKIKKELIDFNPNVLIGYVSLLEIVASYIVEMDIKLNVDRVITCGEPLSATSREKLEKIFNVKVIDCYGASESIAIGVQNDIEDGMYLLDDLNIVEVENTSIYLTNLNNFTMPFIRYEINDLLVKKDSNKNCKLPYTNIEKVRGRSSDVMWLDNKKDFIHPLQIEGYRLKGMSDFQLVKTSEQSFVVNVKMNDIEDDLQEKYFTEIRKELGDGLTEILSNKKLNNIHFEIKKVKNLQIDSKSKKKKFIINDIK